MARAAVLILAAMAIEFSRDDLESEEAALALYARWSARYNLTREASERARRFPIFVNNVRRVLNTSSGGYVGINGFGDLTEQEVAEIYSCAIPPLAVKRSPSAVDASSLPGAVDWTAIGYDIRHSGHLPLPASRIRAPLGFRRSCSSGGSALDQGEGLGIPVSPGAP
ncbi:unnamed protein product [Urochloa humidicola]